MNCFHPFRLTTCHHCVLTFIQATSSRRSRSELVIDFRVQIPKPDRVGTRADYMMRYVDIFDLSAVSYTLDELLRLLDEAGIGRAVMQAEWSSGDYLQENETVAAIVRQHTDRFVGFALVDAADGMVAVEELKRSVETLGLRGLNVQPFASRLHANHKKFYPLYLKCLEYGIPVAIHTGINYSYDRTIDFGRPIYVDEVACDFPDEDHPQPRRVALGARERGYCPKAPVRTYRIGWHRAEIPGRRECGLGHPAAICEQPAPGSNPVRNRFDDPLRTSRRGGKRPATQARLPGEIYGWKRRTPSSVHRRLSSDNLGRRQVSRKRKRRE